MTYSSCFMKHPHYFVNHILYYPAIDCIQVEKKPIVYIFSSVKTKSSVQVSGRSS